MRKDRFSWSDEENTNTEKNRKKEKWQGKDICVRECGARLWI